MILLLMLLALPAPAADLTEAVRQAALGWTSAAVRQDRAALEKWLADDLQYGHSSGQLQNKAEYIEAVAAGPPRYESFAFSDVKVSTYGKTAVLTAIVDVKMTGRDLFRVRSLQVWVENGGTWRMTAHQSARVNR